MKNLKMVEITEERYNELLDRDTWLCALEAAGLDNWDGCSNAVDILEEWKEETDEQG